MLVRVVLHVVCCVHAYELAWRSSCLQLTDGGSCIHTDSRIAYVRDRSMCNYIGKQGAVALAPELGKLVNLTVLRLGALRRRVTAAFLTGCVGCAAPLEWMVTEASRLPDLTTSILEEAGFPASLEATWPAVHAHILVARAQEPASFSASGDASGDACDIGSGSEDGDTGSDEDDVGSDEDDGGSNEDDSSSDACGDEADAGADTPVDPNSAYARALADVAVAVPSLALPPRGVQAVQAAGRVQEAVAVLHRGDRVHVKPRADILDDVDVFLPAVLAEEPVPGAGEVKVEFVSGDHGVHPKQQEVAGRLFAAMGRQVSLCDEAGAPRFRDVALYIVCPNINSLCSQTVDRLTRFVAWCRAEVPKHGIVGDFMPSLGPELETVEDHVIKLHCKRGSADEARFQQLRKRIRSEPATLFLVVQDEAHHSATFSGAAHMFMNNATVRASPNVAILRVSATPYNLQTVLAQTPLANEVSWGDTGAYYGLSEYRGHASGGAQRWRRRGVAHHGARHHVHGRPHGRRAGCARGAGEARGGRAR